MSQHKYIILYHLWGYRCHCLQPHPTRYLAATSCSRVKAAMDLLIYRRFLIRRWLEFRCQAKFLTFAKLPTYYCLSVILLLWVKEWSLEITFFVSVVQITQCQFQKLYCTTMTKLIDARDDWIVFFTTQSYPVFKKWQSYPILVVVQIVLSVSENYPKVCL